MVKLLKWLDKHFEEALMAIALSGIVVMMSTHVFFRYVMKSPLKWTEEATRYLFVWFVFIGISYGIRNNTHIRVNVIETLYPKVKGVFGIIQDIIGAAFIFYMVPAAIKSMKFISMRHQISAGLHLPMIYVYGALLVGLFLSVIRIIQRFYLRIFKHQSLEEGGEDK